MKLSNATILLIAVLLTSAATAPAGAQVWFEEVPDAPDGPLPAQGTNGIGALTRIIGATLTDADDIHDAYWIDIVDPLAFSATTSASDDPDNPTSWDTRLWLFDAAGNVLMGNDDAPVGGLQSLLTDPSMWPGTVSTEDLPAPLTVGCHILVISGFSEDAMDATGVPAIHLNDLFSELHGPDPTTGPFAAWEMNMSAASGEYEIALTGAGYCVPEPATLGLLLLGLVPVLLRRS